MVGGCVGRRMRCTVFPGHRASILPVTAFRCGMPVQFVQFPPSHTGFAGIDGNAARDGNRPRAPVYCGQAWKHAREPRPGATLIFGFGHRGCAHPRVPASILMTDSAIRAKDRGRRGHAGGGGACDRGALAVGSSGTRGIAETPRIGHITGAVPRNIGRRVC